MKYSNSNMVLSSDINRKIETNSETSQLKMPDFIIVGAMKSGTTSLHHILNKHEDVFIPDNEIYFFDIDDIEQHPDFFVETSYEWTFHNYDRYFDEYISWYRSFFKSAKSSQIIGEHSTSYMASQKAPPRIAKLLPDVKLIFVLRDPVARTYSAYWHLLRSGRAVFDFEKTIQYVPWILIQRSLYQSHIERYIRYFPEKNMKFIIFEHFVKNTQDTINEVCDFLGLKRNIDILNLDTHKNPAPSLRSSILQILFNRILKKHNIQRYFSPSMPRMHLKRKGVILKIMHAMSMKLNQSENNGYPLMKPKTKRFLNNLFGHENKGLSELIGQDLSAYWPYLKA